MGCEITTIRNNNKSKEISSRTNLYDDDTTLEKSMDCTIETVTSDCSDLSVGNAFNESDIEIYNITDDIEYSIPVPKMTKSRMETPATICTIDTINSLRSRRLLKVLLDSGSRKTLINRSVLPKNTVTKKLQKGQTLKTLAGKVAACEMVTLRDLRLPEFDKNRRIEQQKALVFDTECRYDIILGTDFLSKAGISINYDTGFMEWYENIIPLRDPIGLNAETFDEMEDSLFIQIEDELLGEDWLDSYATEILDAKYSVLDIDGVVNDMNHLTDNQKDDMRNLLNKHKKLFDGTLGVYPHKKFHIDTDGSMTPVHARAYPVPRVHLETFKKELQHLVELGVLVPQGVSEWASPTFIVPKKDGRVRWISDLRQLNKVVKRKQYPLPIISDILRKRIGYEYFTKLDISMQYYTFELDEESQDLCTIVTPFGKFKYARLPMGLSCSPDFAQEVMENIFRDVDDTDVYIDDVGCFSNDWNSHMELMEIVLRKLQENGFTVNPLKCEWAVKETDWLGYWLTPRGLKPWKKKIDAILHMDRPRTATEIRRFVGCVNYYRDMWPSRAHVLKPLTDLAGLAKNAPIVWTDEMDESFKKMKKLMSADALAAYPDHNKKYYIFTDASDFQLGSCLMQDGRPVAYFTKKLTGAQRNYTTMEKELLSIVATLKEFRSMLLGAKIHIFTDHKNLTFENLTTQRVLRWRSYVEEYSPKIHYIEGENNILADNLSRLNRLPSPTELEMAKDLVQPSTDVEVDELENYFDEDEIDDYHTDVIRSGVTDPDIDDMLDSYLNLPEMEIIEENPLNFAHIYEMQQADEKLIAMQQKFPEQYINKTLDDDVPDIICYVRPNDDRESQWRIALPEGMLLPTVIWFHQVLGHPGEKRLRETLQQRYYHPQLRRIVDRYRCEHCLRHKLSGKGYGLLPEREMRIAPWTEVAVDLIGPWEVKVNGRIVVFNALTSIDTASNLVELTRIDNKTSEHVTRKFEQSWLARYPLPTRCVHDMGGEFTGSEFQQLLARLHLKDAQSTSKNPQSNAICERMHQTVANILRTLLHSNPPKNLTQAKDVMDDALATAMHAMRSTVATTIGSTPGTLAL